MSNAIFQVPKPQNEPVLSYAPGSPEKINVKAALQELKSKSVDIPMYIGGKKYTQKKQERYTRHMNSIIHWGLTQLAHGNM